MLTMTEFSEIAQAKAIGVVTDQYEAEPVLYPELVTFIDEGDLASVYGHREISLVGVGTPARKRDGQRMETTHIAEGYKVVMGVFEYAEKLAVPYRMLEDMSASGIERFIGNSTALWGQSFARLKEERVAGIFNNGALTAGHLDTFDNRWENGGEDDPFPKFIYDGKPLFAGDHAAKVSGTTYGNHAAGSALDPSAFNSAMVAMRSTNAKDERDNRIQIRPSSLLVPAALESTGRRVIESAGMPGTANNDTNPYRGAVEVKPWDYLTNAAAWTLYDRSARGLICRDSGAPLISVWEDKDAEVRYVGAKVRFGVAVANWRAFYGGNHSTS